MLQGFRTTRRDRRFGVELEFTIVDDQFVPLLGAAAPVCRDSHGRPVTEELGSFQIEINPPPAALGPGAFDYLHGTLTETVAAVERNCAALGGHLLPIGLAPRLPPPGAGPFFSGSERYRRSLAYSRRHDQRAELLFRPSGALTLPEGRAVALINELHIHIEARSAAEIGALFEAAQDVTPLLVAIGANSGFCEGRPLLELDHQIGLFAQSEARPASRGGAQRVGFYPRPLGGPLDYFDWISRFPVWSVDADAGPAALCEAIERGYYGWVRLRVTGAPDPSLRVELRAPSVQPTVTESLALTEFAIAMVLARMAEDRPPQPWAVRARNLACCARNGLAAVVIWDDAIEVPAATVLDRFLARIGTGTRAPCLLARLRHGTVPAKRLVADAARWGAHEALRIYREHARFDEPYVA